MQRQERQTSDDWELVEHNDVQLVDALKQEGNALFQQRKYLDAVQVYARALALLPVDARQLSASDVESFTKLEIAVRLNRALAYIELKDANLLAYAEEDCSLVLARQIDCVKALYRRALARERLGNIKAALADVEKMLKFEPANPSALQLMARLQESWAKKRPECPTEENALTTALKLQCAVSKSMTSTQKTDAPSDEPSSAVDAWKALQAEEQRLRDLVIKKAASTKACTVKPPASKSRTISNATQVTSALTVPGDGQVRLKTESIWAALTQEEASTVASVYSRRQMRAASKRQTTAGKSNTASIHPSR